MGNTDSALDPPPYRSKNAGGSFDNNRNAQFGQQFAPYQQSGSLERTQYQPEQFYRGPQQQPQQQPRQQQFQNPQQNKQMYQQSDSDLQQYSRQQMQQPTQQMQQQQPQQSQSTQQTTTNQQFSKSDLSPQQLQLLKQQEEYSQMQTKQQYALLEVFSGEPMDVCWVFWKDNVDILPRNRQKELSLLLYSHMFQKIPTARRLFIRGDIDTQALKFLDMLGWLVRRLKAPDQGSLIKSLQSLGARHTSWGVRAEYFQPMLEALHAALSDHFKHTYTIRVKFCIEQLFTAAANVMTGQDLFAMFSARYTGGNQLRFLNSLDDCLADPLGQEYLERFLIQSFCAELVHFHRIYKQYRGALSDTERHVIASRIVMEFLTPNAKTELMISPDLKNRVIKKLMQSEKKAKSKGGKILIPPDLFDPIYEWVKSVIQENSWPKFKQTIQAIATKSVPTMSS